MYLDKRRATNMQTLGDLLFYAENNVWIWLITCVLLKNMVK